MLRGGLLYASRRAEFKGAAYAHDRSFYQRLRDDPQLPRVYSEVFHVRSTGRSAFAVAYPLRADGEFLGVVVALINLDHWQELTKRLDLGPRGIFAIRRSDDFSLVLRHPPLVDEINRVLLPVNPTRKAITDGKTEAVLRFSAQTDAVPRIFALRTLPNHPFYLLAAVAEEDALRDWQQRARVIGVAGLLLFWLLGLVLWRLFASERRFRSLFHEAPVAHALTRQRDGRFAEVNAALTDMTGYSREELVQLGDADLVPADKLGRNAGQQASLQKGKHYGPHETEYRRKDGQLIDVRVKGVVFADEDGERMILSVIEDISERKRAEAQLRLMASVFEHAGEAIVITDSDNRIVAVNQSFSRLTGYSAAEAMGKNPRILASGRSTPADYAELWRRLMQDGIWHGEIWDRRKDGSVYPKWLTISVMKNEQGEITHHIGSFTDISERKAAEEQIRHLAHHDALTGLPNRFHLIGRLEQALATARRDGTSLAVMFLDLDRFKLINDTLGHPIGDRLLVEVGCRLRACVRDSDIVARLGGDEFVVVITGVEAATARQVADKILLQLGQPYRIDDDDLHTTPSLGIAFFPDDGDSVDVLMKNADTAMYHAKSAGRNNVQFFTARMNEDASARLALEQALRLALERGEFELHYQPQIDLHSRHVIGVEALVRWRHPVDGMIPPLKFIPLAEETGLIVPLGQWVLEEAVRQLAAWRDAGLGSLKIAVNVSVQQLHHREFVDVVGATLRAVGIAPESLELEITESVAMDEPQTTIELLGQLRAMGVELAIDDFGTGYSSLSYLKLFPIQRLKLDRSFVMDIEHDPNDAAICSATIAMARSLGLGTVAEGVETVAQRDFLARLGCDIGQGYLFSPPRPAGELAAYLASHLAPRDDA